MNMAPRCVCYVDFDGTITTLDVGDAMFEEFGGASATAAVREYREGRISAVECFMRESDACGSFSVSRLDEFLATVEIDKSFIGFVSFCRSHRFEVCILSDGMDYYISSILNRFGLSDVPFFSNSLELVAGEDSGAVKMKPAFPYTDETCDRCASCKRNHMLTKSSDDDIILYVGEGYSDRCPVRYADVIFAKDDLLTYCRTEGLPHHEYRTFADVAEAIRRSIGAAGTNRNILRKRRQAELARKEAFLSE